jgi:hypothetical protein
MRPSGEGTAPCASMHPWYSGLWIIAAWVGMTPAVTKRNGGRGSSSKLVRLIVVSTLFVLGSMTLSVFESSLVMKTRSCASTLAGARACACACSVPSRVPAAPAAAT